MPFSNFTLASATAQFGLLLQTKQSLFAGIPAVSAGKALHDNLEEFGQLALSVNTEKARSEWMIAPVLAEMWRRSKATICLLSGVDFTFDIEAGLNGVVDFMVGLGEQVPFMTAPVLAVVEAKNESIAGGLGQCAAEMIASLRLNQQAKTHIDTIYGIVSNGNNWRFLRLHGSELVVDNREYLIIEVDQILGILLHIVGLNPVVETKA
jgi:hypothetical protein